MTDETLAERCRQGDAAAWETLVRRHQDRILNLAYQFTHDSEEARDLAQEIFIRLYLQLERYDAGRPFRTWFNRLARNLCIDHYRHNRRERQRVATPVDEIATLAAPGPGPQRRLDARERRTLILRGLEALSEVSREAIILKDLQQLSLEEIAAILGVPLGTVKSRVFRARIDLGRALLRLDASLAGEGTSHGMP